MARVLQKSVRIVSGALDSVLPGSGAPDVTIFYEDHEPVARSYADVLSSLYRDLAVEPKLQEVTGVEVVLVDPEKVEFDAKDPQAGTEKQQILDLVGSLEADATKESEEWATKRLTEGGK